MLPVRRESESGLDVPGGEFREVGDNIRMRHAGRQPRQYVIHRNAHVPDARFPAPFSGFDGDALAVIIHTLSINRMADKGRGSFGTWADNG